MYPLRFHCHREHHTHPEAPSCALWVQPSQPLPHHPTVRPSQPQRTSQRFAIATSPHSQPRIIDWPHRPTLVFSMHFCPLLCTPGKTSLSITHPEIALGQARLTPDFFTGGLPEKKVYLGGMSILSILLSLELGCHNLPPLEDQHLRRSTPSQKRPLLATSVRSVLAYVYRTSS
jgi:hypothetical protein